MTTEGNGPRYAVHMSKQTRAHLKQLHLKAAQEGNGQPFLTAFRQILEWLRRDPWQFGEPVYTLPALHLKIRKAAIAPLVVDFGVHQDKPLVFIRGFKALS